MEVPLAPCQRDVITGASNDGSKPSNESKHIVKSAKCKLEFYLPNEAVQSKLYYSYFTNSTTLRHQESPLR